MPSTVELMAAVVTANTNLVVLVQQQAKVKDQEEKCYDSFHARSRICPCTHSVPDQLPTFHARMRPASCHVT